MIRASGCMLEVGVRGNSLQGYTKRSGRSPGHSPGFQLAGQLSVRQYLVLTNNGEVLPYRQPHGHNNLIAVFGRQHIQQGQQVSSGNQPLGW